MNVPPKQRFIISSSHSATVLSLHLIENSRWFECEPYPDAEFCFTVKPETVQLMEDLMAIGVCIRRE